MQVILGPHFEKHCCSLLLPAPAPPARAPNGVPSTFCGGVPLPLGQQAQSRFSAAVSIGSGASCLQDSSSGNSSPQRPLPAERHLPETSHSEPLEGNSQQRLETKSPLLPQGIRVDFNQLIFIRSQVLKLQRASELPGQLGSSPWTQAPSQNHPQDRAD